MAASRNTRGIRDNVAVASDDDGGRLCAAKGGSDTVKVCVNSPHAGGDGEYG